MAKPTVVQLKLKKLKVKFQLHYSATHLIDRIKLPLSDKEIVDLLDKEGKNLGVCCSAISSMRDIVFDAVREGGWIDCSQLRNFYENALSHDHFKLIDLETDWKKPVTRIMRLWEVVKPEAHDKDWSRHLNETDLDEPDDCLEVISGLSTWFSFNLNISDKTKPGDYRHLPLMLDFHVLALGMNKYLQEMHKVTKALKFPKSTKGFGVFIGDNIARNRNGVCVYADKKTAEAVVKNSLSNKEEDFKEEDFNIKPVRISLKNGLEVL